MTTQEEQWREATADMILRFRQWAIRYGAKPILAWGQVSDRVRLAARRANSVETWCSDVCRSLRIGTTDSETSRAMVEFAALVGAHADRWLNWLEDEHQFLMALARERLDSTKNKRRNKSPEETSP